jgi:ribosomal protein S18 acetylase RimI-like enzyme
MSSPADTPPTSIRHGSSRVRCSVVPWDTAIMGVVAGQLDGLAVGTEDETEALLADVRAWADAVSAGFISCRLDHRALRESMAIESIGFRYVETILRPMRSLASPIDTVRSSIDIARARPGDLPALEAIAARAFDTGRFAMDWRLPARVNGERYAAWVRSSLANGSHEVLAASQDGEIVGLFITETVADRTAYWHLTAIDPARQGQGLGRQLWTSMLQRHRDDGMRAVETRISSHNTAVLNLYARLGFRFGDAEMTFHQLRLAKP